MTLSTMTYVLLLVIVEVQLYMSYGQVRTTRSCKHNALALQYHHCYSFPGQLDTGSELVKKTPSDTLGRSVFEHGIVVRRAIWSCKSSMGKVYPTLSPVARRLLSLHATSAASERNWSHWGRLYRLQILVYASPSLG